MTVVFVGCGLVAKCLIVVIPMGCSPPGSSVHAISRQEYWNGLSFPSPGDIPDTGIEPVSPVLHEHSLPLSHQ